MSDQRPAAPPSLKPRITPVDESVDPIDVPARQVAVAAPPPAEPSIELSAETSAASTAPTSTLPTPPTPPTVAFVDQGIEAGLVAQAEAPAVTTPSAEPVPLKRMRRQEVTVQIASRVKLQTRDDMEYIVDRDQVTMRQGLEDAIAYYRKYGPNPPTA